jgi:hypothetical protein
MWPAEEPAMKALTALIASLCIALPHGSAIAHGDHKPTHGGDIGRGSDEIVVEFVMESGTLKLYVTDDSGKPLDTQKLQGTLSVIPAQGPAQHVSLTRAGPHQLAAPGATPKRGDRLRAVIRLPSGEQFESVTLFSR